MAKPIILCDCAGMANDRWLECRAHGPKGDIPYTVGGSDVAAIFGLSPWTTPLELWLTKKGRMKAPAKSNEDQLEMGHLLEPIAAHWFEKKTGNLVTDDTNLYQHADHPYANRYTYRTGGTPARKLGSRGSWSAKAAPTTNRRTGRRRHSPLLRAPTSLLPGRAGCGVTALSSCVWGNNPGTDLAMPEIIRDKAKEDMIFERLEQWVWSLEHDKPPTMEDVKPKLALESLARIYGASLPGLPTVEFSPKYERSLRQIALLQEKIASCNQEIKTYEKEMEAHSVRIAEVMKEHEHGVLTTTKDKLLIDFVTRTTKRPDSKALKEKYPSVYSDVLKVSESRKVKVHIEPA